VKHKYNISEAKFTINNMTANFLHNNIVNKKIKTGYILVLFV